MDRQQALIQKIAEADRAGANAVLEEWAEEHGYESLFTDLLEPALLRIGDDWRSSSSFSIAQAYVAGKVAEDALTKIADRITDPSADHSNARPVVLGNIEDDFHALGRRMVGTFLRAKGWEVYDLGNDVPAEEFVDKAVEVGARVIGVSAMMLTTARNIAKLRAEIDRRGLTDRIRLAVGGAVFVVLPELVEQVGGDGTAPNALKAFALFDELWAKSVEAEKKA